MDKEALQIITVRVPPTELHKWFQSIYYILLALLTSVFDGSLDEKKLDLNNTTKQNTTTQSRLDDLFHRVVMSNDDWHDVTLDPASSEQWRI